MVRIEIDGKEIEARQGSMIIEAADRNDIAIPRFCYHKKLSIAANCRMCLVEVEKARKPLPACATPVTEGMKIWTKSEATIAAQKSVMEFLLINHPLDCPICDQGGECELQDVSMEYGSDISRFAENKTVVKDKTIGPLISTDMTRCILCTRCVRFGEQIAGTKELGVVGRGAFTEISTFVEQSLSSEVSGNVIDLCPVGALTNKPFRFKARSWELQATPSVAPHDCLGSNIFIHSRRGQALRAVPRENEQVNEVWISDRDRYSIEGVNHTSRLQKPIIKQKGKWVELSFDKALNVVVKKLKQIIKNHGGRSIGTLISSNTTIEEQYLTQKLMRALGSNNIDHRLRQNDFSNQELAPLFPNLGIGLDELEQQDGVLLVGSNLPKEQPIAALKLRKMLNSSGNIFVVNPANFKFNFDISEKIITPPEEIMQHLTGIAKAALIKSRGKVPDGADKLLANVKPGKVETAIANKLLSLEKRLILIGTLVQSEADYSKIIVLANLIAKIIHAKLGVLTDGANSAGAWLSGCLPHRDVGGKKLEKPGFNAKEILTNSLKAYCFVGVEPELDYCYGDQCRDNLKDAELVVAFSAFNTKKLQEVADIILPIASFAESSGSYVNVSGILQTVAGAANPVGEARPLWKILRVLGNLFMLPGFEFESNRDILAELELLIGKEYKLSNWGYLFPKNIESDNGKNSNTKLGTANMFTRIPIVPLYSTDMLTRHSLPLQQTNDAIAQSFVYVNSKMAATLEVVAEDKVKITNNKIEIVLPLKIDDSLLDFTAIIPQALDTTSTLGVTADKLSIEKV